MLNLNLLSFIIQESVANGCLKKYIFCQKWVGIE